MPKPLEDVSYPVTRLRTSPQQVYSLARRNLIPHVKVGRRTLFDPDAIERWIAAGGTRATNGNGGDHSSAP
jgi:excisionase family DNA binding protein